MCVAEHLAVHTVTNSEVFRCYSHRHVLTLVDRASSRGCCDKNYTVDAFADLNAINGCTNVKI